MRNKRGQGLPVSTIIIVILVILVLVIVAAAFTGGMKTLIDKIKASLHMYSAADVEQARELCNDWCSLEYYKTFCTYEFTIGEEKKSCEDVGSTCPDADCTKTAGT